MPANRSDIIKTTMDWALEKCKDIIDERKAKHAEDARVSDGWAHNKPKYGSQMIHHKGYRVTSLCEFLDIKEKIEKSGMDIDKELLNDILDGIGYNAILLAGLVEDKWIKVKGLSEKIDELKQRGKNEKDRKDN